MGKSSKMLAFVSLGWVSHRGWPGSKRVGHGLILRVLRVFEHAEGSGFGADLFLCSTNVSDMDGHLLRARGGYLEKSGTRQVRDADARRASTGTRCTVVAMVLLFPSLLSRIHV
jgi:hypothetical protein